MAFTNYHSRYHYPWRWAVLAELAWRLEHVPLSHESQPLERLSILGYRWRKACEHRGHAASRETHQGEETTS